MSGATAAQINRGLDLLGYDADGNYNSRRDTQPSEVERRARRRPRLPSTQQIATKLRAAGLRPVIDTDLDLVRADCPDCRAGDRDPLGLWRPLAVMASELDGRVISYCDGCSGVSFRLASDV